MALEDSVAAPAHTQENSQTRQKKKLVSLFMLVYIKIHQHLTILATWKHLLNIQQLQNFVVYVENS